ncbi:IS110 family transposase [Dyadobacter frigoris]|uniref:IS110 family transposase n=1 Tax=Dyadobacter frigoris TaxID=2576211 RepID=A0A4U6D8V7_9BACT|nr:IS110 family transposase [Dyadobacter frigoris]TKT92548.1 IS110 family transposase [Dyadobacter frigoris]GLU55342.1 IS110 family transposase [Dyadobacter frigoris]
MKKVIKQVLGIDVAQKELVVCLGRMHDDWTPELYANKTFANTSKGFLLVLSWIKKLTIPDLPVRYVMEATGVYHESLAYFLKDQGLQVSIVLPNKISNYARSLTIKTITDKTSSEAITQFGLERSLDEWKKPTPIYKRMRQLTRERDQIVLERTMVKNNLHAELSEAQPNETSLQRINKRIVFLDKQEKEITAELSELIKEDEKVSGYVNVLCSLPGVGLLTAATVLAETNGFDLIRNKRQLTSYAGLDVKEKQSGTSVRGKSKISKKGNKYLRKTMHMPALCAIRYDNRFKGLFIRLVSRHGIKMKAVVAVQRKLLEMMYTIFKNNEKYDKEYLKKQLAGDPAAGDPEQTQPENINKMAV